MNPPSQEQGVEAVRGWLTPVRLLIRGPYARNDPRARLRRLLEGWMPNVLSYHFRRVELAIRFRGRLRDVPLVAVVDHDAWVTRADVEWAEQVARNLETSTPGPRQPIIEGNRISPNPKEARND